MNDEILIKQPVKIRITRLFCHNPYAVTFRRLPSSNVDVIRLGNDAIHIWARMMAVDETDRIMFEIIYNDGKTYRGRMEISNKDHYGDTLGRFINITLAYRSGQTRPSHLTEEQHKEVMENNITTQERALKWISGYRHWQRQV